METSIFLIVNVIKQQTNVVVKWKLWSLNMLEMFSEEWNLKNAVFYHVKSSKATLNERDLKGEEKNFFFFTKQNHGCLTAKIRLFGISAWRPVPLCDFWSTIIKYWRRKKWSIWDVIPIKKIKRTMMWRVVFNHYVLVTERKNLHMQFFGSSKFFWL